MIETLSQQTFQLQYLAQQQTPHCRHSAGLFQHRPVAYPPSSPSPLGSRNVNAQSLAFPAMSTRGTAEGANNVKSGEPSDQENLSPFSPASSGKIFSFSPPTHNTVTPPPKQSTYEARYRRSGGSNNPFTKIFGSPQSPNANGSTSTSSASRHRQLFLNKVKQNRDDARFNTRGETLMMMEYHSEQQSWDEQMRQRADTIFHQDHLLEEEDEVLAEGSNNDYHIENEEMAIADPDISAFEEYLMQQQDPDMQASLEHQSPASKSTQSDRSSFCGDDGDYDDIFMELVENNNGQCDYQDQSQDSTMSF